MISSKVYFLLLSVLLLTGCTLTGPDGSVLTVGKDDGGFYVVDSNLASVVLPDSTSVGLRAQVKGSIYETGELMSVFGTCLDANDQPINGSTAVFSAWYPNGTQFINMTPMTEIQSSYFLHQSNMQAVEGTYLTEMMCQATIDNVSMTAVAFGEWQNPFWVKRLSLLNDSISDISLNVSNITLQLNDLSVEMNNSFEITWDMIQSVNTTVNTSVSQLNDSIYYVATLVNDSWYDNSTYIAQMLQNITNLITYGVNNTGNPLNYTETHSSVVYMTNWKITVQAIDPVTGINVQYPDSLCYINTTLTTTPTLMTPKGVKWEFFELITILGDYSWSVSCVYA